jgi:putative hemolysin
MVDDDPPSEEADSGLVRTQDGAFIVDGGMTIIELNDRLEDEGLELPEGEYQTVAGLIIAQLGEIPDESNVVQTGDSLITVMNMEGARIDRVRLERVDAAQTGDCG